MPEQTTEIALNIDYTSNYYRSIASGVARYSHCRKWRFYTTGGIPQISLDDLRQWKGAGVIGRLTPELISDLQQRGIPAVNIKADYLDLPAVSVLMDNMRIGQIAAELFIEKGIRRFAATAWSIRGASGMQKVQGFVQTLNAQNFPVVLFNSRQDIQQIRELLQIKNGETVGVFAAEDFLGRMVIEACEDSDLHIPENVAVIGVDNSPFICEMLVPTMSSIELGAERVGYQAAALLDRLIKGEPIPPRPVMLAPERIVERKSTDILKSRDELVARALHFVRDNVSKPITVLDVTAAAFCSRRVLEKKFKQEVGRTLHEEIRRSRIEYACKLLRESDMLIETLAETCGYGSRERFNVAFRREIGKTPSSYRKEYRFTRN